MQVRLGRNHGRYYGETIPVEELQASIHEEAIRHGWCSSTFLDSGKVTLRGYRRLSTPEKKRIYISTGIHGDEPSGPLAVREALRENRWPEANLWLMPMLNPTGFRLNTRENEAGIDLNRDYRHLRSEEVKAHVRWLELQPSFNLSLFLHEDWEANGFYVYEVNPDNHPSLAPSMIEAAREICLIETAELVDNFTCTGGIIRPMIRPEDRPLWAEAVYLLARHKSRQNYTIETPSDFPLEFRAKIHGRVLRAALDAFLNQISIRDNSEPV